MSVTQEQIDKIATNLGKVPANKAKLTDDINGILDYIELLNEVDTQGVTPTVNVINEKKALRKDELLHDAVKPQELLNCSPQKVIGDQIAISSIM